MWRKDAAVALSVFENLFYGLQLRDGAAHFVHAQHFGQHHRGLARDIERAEPPDLLLDDGG